MVEAGLVQSRSQAQALILAGKVLVNRRLAVKAGGVVRPEDHIEVQERLPYVSRGGLKLARAIEVFGLYPANWTVVDVGSSTGGFTDCWLKHGAAEVYAVDVGYGQLDWRLRTDPRVKVLERTNGRYLRLADLARQQPVDAASVDASFIGVHLLLGPLASIVRPEGVVVALIKPQFEAGPSRVGKGGVVRDPAVHREVLERFMDRIPALGYGVEALAPSPVRGPEGNIEFLACLRVGHAGSQAIDPQAVIIEAWEKGSQP